MPEMSPGAALRELQQAQAGLRKARALLKQVKDNPRLVVCDEPTSALDHETGNAVMELLTDVAVRPGRAVVVVTHDSRVLQFADRIAHMDDGRIVETRGTGSKAMAETLVGVN